MTIKSNYPPNRELEIKLHFKQKHYCRFLESNFRAHFFVTLFYYDFILFNFNFIKAFIYSDLGDQKQKLKPTEKCLTNKNYFLIYFLLFLQIKFMIKLNFLFECLDWKKGRK